MEAVRLSAAGKINVPGAEDAVLGFTSSTARKLFLQALPNIKIAAINKKYFFISL
jgi:hypothetical protein